MQQTQNRKGFSLIELIVVLGIIAGGLGVAFSYITQTEKSKDIFHYQSALKDLVVAVNTYEQFYGTDNLTLDSLERLGLLPATWTPLEATAAELGKFRKTANGEFLLHMAKCCSRKELDATGTDPKWVFEPKYRQVIFVVYKHPFLVNRGDPAPPEANLLNAYCQKLMAEKLDLSCLVLAWDLKNGDRLHVQHLRFPL